MPWVHLTFNTKISKLPPQAGVLNYIVICFNVGDGLSITRIPVSRQC